MAETFRFADFVFDPATGELRRNGHSVRLEPKPARALALLLSRASDLVSRDELRAHLWPDDVTVDFDRGLAYCLSQVRGALGDSADAPRFVETLPRRGFRFVAPVERAVTPEEAPRELRSRSTAIRAAIGAMVVAIVAWGLWQATASLRPGGSPGQVLAVAVFDNETGDAAFDRDVAGFSDAIVGSLVDLAPARLVVAGQNRVLRLPRDERDLADIAESTGATHVVLGQLQRRDAELVVYAHLLSLPDGRHVWGGTFPVVDGQVAVLQGQVAQALHAAVRERLLESGR